VKVSVFGGYSDERGDAMRNSMSLLTALHETDRILEVSTPLNKFYLSIRILSTPLTLIRILKVSTPFPSSTILDPDYGGKHSRSTVPQFSSDPGSEHSHALF